MCLVVPFPYICFILTGIKCFLNMWLDIFVNFGIFTIFSNTSFALCFLTSHSKITITNMLDLSTLFINFLFSLVFSVFFFSFFATS